MKNVHPIMLAALMAVMPPPEVRVVHFHKVGPNKASWTARLPDVSEETIAAEARKALYSSGVVADFEEDSETKGVIVVGGVRIVGEFSVEPLTVPA